MKEKEKQLFKAICDIKSDEFDEALIDAATPCVLGYLFFNRMPAVAYGNLKRHGMLGKVNREFRNSLNVAYEKNIEKNKTFTFCVQQLTEILNEYKGEYAMLKGAYLCGYYPEGYRTSNDIDLLVLPENVTDIGEALLKAGFKQGNIRNGIFVEATRKEIIESKMLRGETVPYIKEISLPSMKYLEVDINFSLDYKNGDSKTLKNILNRVHSRKIGNFEIQTLDAIDFFIHLCSHLYKEATTLPWIEMMRDMTLYKYCDIYMLLCDMDKQDIQSIFSRSKELETEKICAFAILQTSELFNVKNEYAKEKAVEVLKEDINFIHQVISPKENKIYIYEEKDIFKRFFAENRKELLREV